MQTQLSHKDIKDFIKVNELPTREKEHEDASIIFKYGSFVGSHIENHEKLGRTMEHARGEIIAAGRDGKSFSNGSLYLAKRLQESKGRFKRVWHAPEGGLWGCLVHVGSLLPESRQLLPLSLGLACYEAMSDYGAADLGVRWVNDVLWGKKKVAGFLVESFTDPKYHEAYDLIGFGINLNNTQFPKELDGLAVSLKTILNKKIDIDHFTCLFLSKLSWYLGLLYFEEANFLKNGSYSGTNDEHLLLSSWKKATNSIGQRVVFGFDVETTPQYTATVLDIKKDGGLVLGFDDGNSITEYSGEIRYL